MATSNDSNLYAKMGKREYASYYSGTDIRIYFGDQWVDEIVEIEWTLQEQLAPIYGYASYTWDKVARGNRYVQGSFVINFKEVGYLQTILNGLSSDMTDDKEFFNLDEFKKWHNGTVNDKAPSYQKGQSAEMVIENFEALAESYENALWGMESDSSGLIDARKNDSFFYSVEGNAKNKVMKDHGFNILMSFGDTGDKSRGQASRWTAQTIVGVQLTGMSQRIDPSGNPVAEVYSFLAKDISGNVTQPY